MSKDHKRSDRHKDGLARRDFLRIGGMAGLAAGTTLPQRLASTEATAAESPRYPVVDVAPLTKLEPGTTVDFSYPDTDAPALLLRLDGPADGGIGPNESVVAFSLLCTHKGCPLNFKSERNMLICPCHWSSFDPAKAGRLVIGQASDPLPQITLRVTDGIVQAIGISGLIYGRHTNII
ncbi:MAG: arsenate reductase (azurin) small subunit [Methyloligellaceae bacterium]